MERILKELQSIKKRDWEVIKNIIDNQFTSTAKEIELDAGAIEQIKKELNNTAKWFY